MTFTQARRKLGALVPQKYTRTQLATEIGCSLDHLSHVLAGRKSFGMLYAPRIQELFQIPQSAWFTRRNSKAA